MDGLTALIFCTAISYVLAVFLSDVVEYEMQNHDVKRRAKGEYIDKR